MVIKTQTIVGKEKSIFPLLQKIKNKFLLMTILEDNIYETVLCDLLNKDGPVHGYKLEASSEADALQNHSNMNIVLNALISSNKDINLKHLRMYLSTL